MIMVKNSTFFPCLFLGKNHLEQMFGDLFDRKESFIA